MKSQRAVTMLTLIVTIVIMLIIISIIASNTSSTIRDAYDMRVTEELRNVQEFVSNKKTKFMIGDDVIDYTPATDSEIDTFFTGVTDSNLSAVAKRIKSVNSTVTDPLYKFYKLTPNQIEDVNEVKNTYIINFGLNCAVCVYEKNIKISGNIYDSIE